MRINSNLDIPNGLDHRKVRKAPAVEMFRLSSLFLDGQKHFKGQKIVPVFRTYQLKSVPDIEIRQKSLLSDIKLVEIRAYYETIHCGVKVQAVHRKKCLQREQCARVDTGIPYQSCTA